MTDNSVIATFESRTRQLIDDHKRLVKLCAELSLERDSLKAENRTLQVRLKELDGELSRMQLTEGLTGESRNREKARSRVNRLMREVDKCISLLNKPVPATAANNAAGAQDAEQ